MDRGEWQLSDVRRVRPPLRGINFIISGSEFEFCSARRVMRTSLPNATPDDGLWAAYRRRDKAAVTEKLLRRSLARMASLNFPERIARMAFGRPVSGQ
jgi:hypothetical protein